MIDTDTDPTPSPWGGTMTTEGYAFFLSASPSDWYQLAYEVADSMPLNRNPTTSFGEGKLCAYTGADGCHCLIGEMLERIGVSAPGMHCIKGIRALILGWKDLHEGSDTALDLIQMAADRPHLPQPPLWGDLRPLLREGPPAEEY